MRRFALLLMAVLGLGIVSHAQVSTEGTDFWLGFMQNADGGQPSSLEIFITANEPANGSIIVLQDGRVQPFSITPGTTYKFVVSNANNNPFAASGSGNIALKGIHIISSANVSVYAFNKRNLSADATVVLPTPTLGKDYIVASYFENSGQNNIESEFLVVGTEDGTAIEITPSVTTVDGKQANVPYTVTLNMGETLQVQALADLTGSLIKSASSDPTECKNFAVFGGNQWTRIGSCGGANDQLFEQLFPTNTWGKNFTVVPFLGRNSNGDLYRIIASEANTTMTITVDGGVGTVTTLNDVGDYVSGNVSNPTSISSDKPIQVVQYSKSQCAEINGTGNSPGDPFMLVISPNEQLLNKVTFNTLDSDVISNYYTTIITKTASRDQTSLDGATINGWTTLISNPDLSYARVGLSRNRDYTVEAPDGFISYVYGFGVIESFGYAAGASLENLNLQAVGVDETIGLIITEGCLNSEVLFSAEFETRPGEDPIYNTFMWDFGDGNTASGIAATHTYKEPGSYIVSLIASNGTGACGTSEQVDRSVTIREAAIDEFIGPASVCPDVTGITYSVSGTADNTYNWTISGGTIVSGGTGTEISVDWGAANDNASITVTPVNSLGCIGETITLDVKINKRLEPALPTGALEVCFLDLASVTYSTPPTNGSEYEWFVSNGTILTDNSLNTIDIMWDGVGTGEVWYREFNPNISDCEGFSDRLNVIIYDEIIPSEVVTDALCNGEASGTISLSVVGGKGVHTAAWSNGATGLDVTGLAAGTYTATISDELGCEIQRDYVVGEPLVLETTSSVLPVRCFQESNGEITMNVQGGTPPYSYHYTGVDVDQISSSPILMGLFSGDYHVQVTDANGCVIEHDVFVDEPMLLEPDLETLVNLPICPQATDGAVSIDGKGGTPGYQFFWNTTPAQERMEATGLSQGLYTVTIIDANGCEATLDVEVRERFPRVFIPNAFSPNNDGNNDQFMAVTDCMLSFNMQVFNRWGSIVFVSNDISIGWDGTSEGKLAPDGNYTYKVFYSGSLNGVPFEETLSGNVRVFR